MPKLSFTDEEVKKLATPKGTGAELDEQGNIVLIGREEMARRARSDLKPDGTTTPLQPTGGTNTSLSTADVVAQSRQKLLDTFGEGTVETPDEQSIRENIRKNMQERVDAINAAALAQIEEARTRGKETKQEFGGRQRALQAAGGTLGSVRGVSQKQQLETGIERKTAQEVRGIEAQKQARLSQVFAEINNRVDKRLELEQNRLNAEAQNAQQAAALELQFTQENLEKAKENIKTIAGTGVDLESLTPEQKEELKTQGGFASGVTGDLAFEAFYNAHKNKADQVKYSYMQLNDGTLVRTGDDGSLKNFGQYNPPDDSGEWKLKTLDDGTLVQQNNITGEIVQYGEQGQFAKLKDTQREFTITELNGLKHIVYDDDPLNPIPMEQAIENSGASSDVDFWARAILDGTANVSAITKATGVDRTQVIKRIQELQQQGYKSEYTRLTPEQLTNVNIIAKALQSDQTYKDMLDVKNGFMAVQTGINEDNSFGDLAAVNGFQKIVDPGVSVRQEEFKTVSEAEGFLKKWSLNLDRFWTGDTMTSAGRQKLFEVAISLYNDKATDFNTNSAPIYKNRAEAANVPFNLIGQEFKTYNRETGFAGAEQLPPTEQEFENMSAEDMLSLVDDENIKVTELSPGQYKFTVATEEGDYVFIKKKVSKEIEQFSQAVSQQESGGRYDALSPVNPNGQRAYGKYQVLASNIPVWTQEVLGREMTPEEFLNDPDAQDKVAQTKMQEMLNKYGNLEDVAAVWFSGRPLASNTASDITGTTVPRYVQNVMSIYKRTA